MRVDVRTKGSTGRRRRWITTIDGECPRCDRHSLIRYVDDAVTIGCLDCGWKEIESIDRSIQKAFDDLKRTLKRISSS